MEIVPINPKPGKPSTRVTFFGFLSKVIFMCITCFFVDIFVIILGYLNITDLGSISFYISTSFTLNMIKITKTQKLILYSLRQFYQSLNQPLSEKHLRLRTSKIAFIELLLASGIVGKQERALYKNLETLEDKKLIEYEKRMVKFTEKGVKIMDKINKEVKQFIDVKEYFKEVKKPKRKLQTTIS